MTAHPEDDRQRAVLLERGLLPARVIDRALSSRKDPQQDLLTVLADRSLLTADVADRIRIESRGEGSGTHVATFSSGTAGRFFAGGKGKGEDSETEAELRRELLAAREAYKKARGQLPYFAPHVDTVFERLDKLGEGGMGVVYRVFDARLGREAALKILHDNATERDAERFLREARVTAHLDHPAVPPVYEFGTSAEGQHYLLMRVIEGQTLKEKIADWHNQGRKRGDLRELIEVLIRVGEALAYAHSRGILHRDLKPSNIMVGRFGEVLLMDWGIARNISGHDDLQDPKPDPKQDPKPDPKKDQRATASQAFAGLHEAAPELTRAGYIVGTLGYMPPEQVTGDELDQRADVFAFGAVLFQLLTKRLPIIGDTPMAMASNTAHGKILSPRALDRRVPRDLDAICSKALQRDAKLRFSSAQEMVDELKRWLNGEELRCVRYTPQERLVLLFMRRPALAITAIGAMLLAFVVFAALALLLILGAQRRAALADARHAEEARARAEAQRTQAEQEKARAEAQRALAEEQEKAARAAREQAEEIQRRIERSLTSMGEAQALAVRKGDPAAIEAAIEGALKEVRPTAAMYQHAAGIYATAGMRDHARRMLEDATLTFQPAFGVLFDLHILALHDRKEAFEIWTDVAPRLRLADKRFPGKDFDSERLFARLIQALELQREGKLSEALELCKAISAATPRFPWVYHHRGVMLLKAGRRAEAIVDLQRFLEALPDHPETLRVREWISGS